MTYPLSHNNENRTALTEPMKNFMWHTIVPPKLIITFDTRLLKEATAEGDPALRTAGTNWLSDMNFTLS